MHEREKERERERERERGKYVNWTSETTYKESLYYKKKSI